MLFQFSNLRRPIASPETLHPNPKHENPNFRVRPTTPPAPPFKRKENDREATPSGRESSRGNSRIPEIWPPTIPTSPFLLHLDCACNHVRSTLPPNMADEWSTEEVELIVADYFEMLTSELLGVKFNKAEHNRALRGILSSRSHGAIERKHQNISAILRDNACHYIDGYKPLSNVQGILRRTVEARLATDAAIHAAMSKAVDTEYEATIRSADLLKMLVDPPKPEPKQSYAFHDHEFREIKPIKKDFLLAEARNRSLGEAGESLVLQFEHERLWAAVARKLADRIEHVSRTKGDGLGFDIQSYDIDGSDRLIEVKTTGFGSMTPFYASRNEVNVSRTRESNFHLYRVFNLRKKPKLFTLKGSLSQTCILEPSQFTGVPA